jgi:hypothetical protein
MNHCNLQLLSSEHVLSTRLYQSISMNCLAGDWLEVMVCALQREVIFFRTQLYRLLTYTRLAFRDLGISTLPSGWYLSLSLSLSQWSIAHLPVLVF